jgi:voltage-gated potassium channel
MRTLPLPPKKQRRDLLRGLRVIVLAAVALCVIAAAFERIAEPAVFTSFGVALYWAVVTVATVGYGDIVPKSPEGRAAAAVIILFGMAWVPAVTSIVVSTISRESDHRTEELRKLLEEMNARLARLEEGQQHDSG